MSAATPSVWGHHLEDPTQPGRAIRLDTPAWAAWLDAATTRSFRYPIVDGRVGYIVSWLTVRKERRQRGGWYWSVYHRDGAQLQRVYLGRSAAVTQARLEAVAQTLGRVTTE